jgi:hypothetical protein
MTPEIVLTHKFVCAIPEVLEERTLYVSVEFATVAHKCCCGCGREVVTPLTPTDWSLIFDGETVSLDPSVGNWNLPCQSHYWIRRNRVHWAPRWSREQVEAGRAADARVKAEYYGTGPAIAEPPPPPPKPAVNAGKPVAVPVREGFWHRWKKRLFGR